jgi:hypothetical protein
MPAKKNRETIPPELAAKSLFLSDRTCCVCRVKGKPVQIHHIDENPANNVLHNFAVLCFDCHIETQISGGFHRKLNADQIILYRDDWLNIVSRQRAVSPNRISAFDAIPQSADLELATSVAEILRDREEYELLALHYYGIGNDELRDKYIELAISQGIDDETLIFFRSSQNKLDLIPPEIIERRVKELEARSDWFSLGRLYRELGDYQLAATSTSKGVIRAIQEGNTFSAAFHLKEMIDDDTLDELFIIAMDDARNQNDLWWQYRCLQELGWDTEGKEFLLEHRSEIENSGEPHFIEELTVALGDTERYLELRKEEAQSISAKPSTANDAE